MTIRMTRFWALLALALPSAVSARVSIPAPFPVLYAESSVVCRGSVVSDTTPENPGELKDGHLMPHDYLVVLKIRYCYKGEAPGGELKLFMPGRDPMGGSMRAGEGLVVFAKAGAGGQYIETNPDDSIYGEEPFGDLPKGAHDNESGLEEIEHGLLATAMTAGAPAFEQAMRLLLRFPRLGEKSIQTLLTMPPTSNQELTMLRLAMLARANPEGYMAELMQAAKRLDPVSAGRWNGEIFELLAERSTAKQLDLLREAIQSEVALLRLGGMMGLRRIKDPSTLPFLVEQLDSKDPEVQRMAVYTLHEMKPPAADCRSNAIQHEQAPGLLKQLWKRCLLELGFSEVK